MFLTPLSSELISLAITITITITMQFQNVSCSKQNLKVRCLHYNGQCSVLDDSAEWNLAPSAMLCCKLCNAVHRAHPLQPTHALCTVLAISSGSLQNFGFRLFQLVPVCGRPGKNRLNAISLPSNGPSTPSVTQNLLFPQ